MLADRWGIPKSVANADKLARLLKVTQSEVRQAFFEVSASM